MYHENYRAGQSWIGQQSCCYISFVRSVGQYTICTVGSVGRCDFVYTVVFGRSVGRSVRRSVSRSLPAHCSARSVIVIYCSALSVWVGRCTACCSVRSVVVISYCCARLVGLSLQFRSVVPSIASPAWMSIM